MPLNPAAISLQLSKRSFTRCYADGKQRAGGKLHRLMQARLPYVLTMRVMRKGVSHVPPSPSEHAMMRRKGLHGPAPKTKARARWVVAQKTGKAKQ